MEIEGADVLPYRTDPEQLGRWVEARARGRSSAQLRELDLPAKSLEGTVASAVALGFLERDGRELTPAGRRFALASEAERRGLLRSALRAYPPYARLIGAIAARPQRSVTDSQWIETWWATHGFGSSQSNRMEGAAVFGRMVDHVGWGRYIPGRRGHPTRIDWSSEAFAGLSTDADSAPADSPQPETRPAPAPPPEDSAPPPVPAPAGSPSPAPAAAPSGTDPYNRIVVPLRSGEVARLEVPQRLSREEKRRLVELLDLLITADG